MKHFSDFNIPKATPFSGEKIKIERVLNKVITVTDYLITDSKFKGKLLTIQIELSGEQRIIFSGSENLIREISKVGKENLPFSTTITRREQTLEFN